MCKCYISTLISPDFFDPENTDLSLKVLMVFILKRFIKKTVLFSHSCYCLLRKRNVVFVSLCCEITFFYVCNYI